MLPAFLRFAAESGGPAIHIAPGEVTTISGVPISNSMLYGWIVGVLLLIIFIWTARRVTIKPKRGFIQIVEVGVEFVIGMVSSSLGSREKGVKYAPYFATIFFFVVFNNWFGLLPGVGEAFTVGGTPLFRPFTADLNGTLAAALLTMILVQTFAVHESGFVRHVRHYFAGSLKNPATYAFGVFEVFTEFTRVVSLALRLFLNVVIGEVIISVFSYLGALVGPITSLPFVGLEMAVGVLQAYIFVMLSITYMAVAIHHDHDDEDHITEDREPLVATDAKKVQPARG